jgi:hypothetical protein
MRFIRVAAGPGSRNAIPTGAGMVWIDLDEVTTITGHLGSNSVDVAVLGDHHPAEHHPSIELTTADGHGHLVALGTFADQGSAFLAIRRFTAALARNDMDSFETGLVALLE